MSPSILLQAAQARAAALLQVQMSSRSAEAWQPRAAMPPHNGGHMRFAPDARLQQASSSTPVPAAGTAAAGRQLAGRQFDLAAGRSVRGQVHATTAPPTISSLPGPHISRQPASHPQFDGLAALGASGTAAAGRQLAGRHFDPAAGSSVRGQVHATTAPTTISSLPGPHISRQPAIHPQFARLAALGASGSQASQLNRRVQLLGTDLQSGAGSEAIAAVQRQRQQFTLANMAFPRPFFDEQRPAAQGQQQARPSQAPAPDEGLSDLLSIHQGVDPNQAPRDVRGRSDAAPSGHMPQRMAAARPSNHPRSSVGEQPPLASSHPQFDAAERLYSLQHESHHVRSVPRSSVGQHAAPEGYVAEPEGAENPTQINNDFFASFQPRQPARSVADNQHQPADRAADVLGVDNETLAMLFQHGPPRQPFIMGPHAPEHSHLQAAQPGIPFNVVTPLMQGSWPEAIGSDNPPRSGVPTAGSNAHPGRITSAPRSIGHSVRVHNAATSDVQHLRGSPHLAAGPQDPEAHGSPECQGSNIADAADSWRSPVRPVSRAHPSDRHSEIGPGKAASRSRSHMHRAGSGAYPGADSNPLSAFLGHVMRPMSLLGEDCQSARITHVQVGNDAGLYSGSGFANQFAVAPPGEYAEGRQTTTRQVW